jgi:hypothetical protein
MSLPNLPLAAATLEVEGQTVSYRSLSRAQALKLSDYMGNMEAQDNFVIACGFGVSEDEARTWRDSTSFENVQKFTDAILELSGLTSKESDQNPK